MSRQSFHDGRITLFGGDCLDVLDTLGDASVDSVVCDPPYHLLSTVKRFAKSGGADRKLPVKDHQYQRLSKGFMGKSWDGGDVAFRAETWAKVLRVLKPGGHVVAFSAPKCSHRMICAIEDAGFEIRDCLMWMFGTGFPKSHNAGDGWGTALKPAYEPICLARKPLIGTVAVNMEEHGTGAINIDACRVAGGGPSSPRGSSLLDTNMNPGWARPWMEDREEVDRRAVASMDRLEALGRWPANVVHDGSGDVVDAFPQSSGQQGYVGPEQGDRLSKGIYGDYGARPPTLPREDTGSAARFFYSAKADSDDRIGSKHPTVKPVDLMRWLVRLVTPVGGTVLDPFAGTGTTGAAAWLEGCQAILIEREEEYRADIVRRMDLLLAGPDEKRGKLTVQASLESLPLFGESAA